jgi:pimeloyl-ACP methyl ester carboxylesterase
MNSHDTNLILEENTVTSTATSATRELAVHHRTARIHDLDIFYRDAGLQDAPAILLLHGFPTSSNMFRNLIPRLANSFRLIAPDYPGFGQSSMPDRKVFAYTFENYTEIVDKLAGQLGVTKYSMYVMDYGAPVGYRLALRHPERVQGLIVQNGNAYDEGLREFWNPIKKYWKDGLPESRAAIEFLVDAKSTRWQYENGVSDRTLLDPTTWILDQIGLDRPSNRDIQMDLMYDYRTNVPLYTEFQAFFRKYQPPTLIVWGKNDFIFPAEGAAPYGRDLKNLETHLLDTGHFALETHGEEIANLIETFLDKNRPLERVLVYHQKLRRFVNLHTDKVQQFDRAQSDSRFPDYFCSSRCEADWVANRLQELALLEVAALGEGTDGRTG